MLLVELCLNQFTRLLECITILLVTINTIAENYDKTTNSDKALFHDESINEGCNMNCRARFYTFHLEMRL